MPGGFGGLGGLGGLSKTRKAGRKTRRPKSRRRVTITSDRPSRTRTGRKNNALKIGDMKKKKKKKDY